MSCWVLQGAMQNSFGSTCHGAGRAMSRSAAMRGLDSKQVSRVDMGPNCRDPWHLGKLNVRV